MQAFGETKYLTVGTGMMEFNVYKTYHPATEHEFEEEKQTPIQKVPDFDLELDSEVLRTPNVGTNPATLQELPTYIDLYPPSAL